MKYKLVNYQEFCAFINSYPTKLEENRWIDHLVTFNDFSKGKWPDSIVAKFFLDYDKNMSDFEIIND